ncbi:HNH endonuclease [Dietzia sp. CW19]|nr:HNH endonuclease [Dietzia sp. CW19]
MGAGEPYPETGSPAAMTIGHIVPRDRGGSSDADNLQVECAHCNETKRAEGAGSEDFDIVWPAVKRLPTSQVRRISEWLAQGYRTRDRLDDVYDRIRMLPPEERARVQAEVRRLLGN